MTLERFVSRLGPSIDMVQKYSARRDTLLGLHFTTLVHLSYRDLKKVLPDLISTGRLSEAIMLVLRSKGHKRAAWRLRFISNYKKLKFIFWIQDQYKIINAMEEKYLVSPPDRKLSAAGIQELDILGDKNLIDALAGGDLLKWGEVQRVPYEDVFDKQLKTVIEARITKRLNKIK